METPRLKRKTWWLMVHAALLPFVLGFGLDFNAVQKQGVQSIYRKWRFSSEIRFLKPNSGIYFHDIPSRNLLGTYFKDELAKDFKLVPTLEASQTVPQVRAFFETSSLLYARIESLGMPGDDVTWKPWLSEARLPNNGFLLGAWVGMLFLILGQSAFRCFFFSVFAYFMWRVNWNALDIPGAIFSYVWEVCRELFWRFKTKNWNAGELGRLPDLSYVLFLSLALTLWSLGKRFRDFFFSIQNNVIFGFLWEPVFLFAASLFAAWTGEASWWKVYLGSLGFRFFFLSGLLFFLFYPGRSRLLKIIKHKPVSALHKNHLFMLLVPAVFLAAGGWSWLHSSLYQDPSQTVERIKVFLVGFAMAFALGSRVYAMGLGVLVLSLIMPPKTGHWNESQLFGLLFDSLFLGWLLSPFKVSWPPFIFRGWATHFAVLSFISWTVGVVLSSVGVPLGLVWSILIFAVWAYAQIVTVPETYKTASQVS